MSNSTENMIRTATQAVRNLSYRHRLQNVESVGDLDFVLARAETGRTLERLRQANEQAQGRRPTRVQQDAG